MVASEYNGTSVMESEHNGTTSMEDSAYSYTMPMVCSEYGVTISKGIL